MSEWTEVMEEIKESISPSYYKMPGGIECIDIIVATQGIEAGKSFCVCNAMKYLFRHNGKNGDEDVLKAKRYLELWERLSEESNK